MRRRTLLATLGTASTIAIAGCSSEESERQEGSTNEESSDDGSSDDGSSESDNTESGSANDNSGSDEPEQLVNLVEHEFYNEGQFDVGVEGVVENVSDQELSYVEVSVYFLDSEGTQIEEGLDNTSDLAAGRRWEFDATYLGDEADRIDSYEIETEVSDF